MHLQLINVHRVHDMTIKNPAVPKFVPVFSYNVEPYQNQTKLHEIGQGFTTSLPPIRQWLSLDTKSRRQRKEEIKKYSLDNLRDCPQPNVWLYYS